MARFFSTRFWSGTTTTGAGAPPVGHPWRAPSVWAPRWWAGSVFAGGQGVSLPEDLLGAVKARFVSQGLATTFAGGISAAEAKPSARAPYVVFTQKSNGVELRTSGSTIERYALGFKVYHATAAQAGEAGDALTASFKDQSLVWAGGYSTPLLISQPGKHERARDFGPGAANLWCWSVEFESRVKRGA